MPRKIRDQPNARLCSSNDLFVASWFDKHLTELIQPQMLRAPEVILEADWDHKVDIWNLGLIVSFLLSRVVTLSRLAC